MKKYNELEIRTLDVRAELKNVSLTNSASHLQAARSETLSSSGIRNSQTKANFNSNWTFLTKLAGTKKNIDFCRFVFHPCNKRLLSRTRYVFTKFRKWWAPVRFDFALLRKPCGARVWIIFRLLCENFTKNQSFRTRRVVFLRKSEK